LVLNAITLYHYWGAKVKRLPPQLLQLDIFRRQAKLAFVLSHTPLKHLPRAKEEKMELYFGG
jgi:hypothetical protein